MRQGRTKTRRKREKRTLPLLKRIVTQIAFGAVGLILIVSAVVAITRLMA